VTPRPRGALASSGPTGGIATKPITSDQPCTDPIACRETPAQHPRTSFRHPQVLRAEADRQIDIHPITFDESGTGWQALAGSDGHA
jgi:hypothetical protein